MNFAASRGYFEPPFSSRSFYSFHFDRVTFFSFVLSPNPSNFATSARRCFLSAGCCTALGQLASSFATSNSSGIQASRLGIWVLTSAAPSVEFKPLRQGCRVPVKQSVLLQNRLCIAAVPRVQGPAAWERARAPLSGHALAKTT